jgi:Family of unknown function (DUF5343)
MAQDLPYLPTYKNVGALFQRIEKAKVPEVFTMSFLSSTMGLKASGDRALITLLKKLGFLDNSGKPTESYNALKNKAAAGGAIAAGIRRAYAPLYAANEQAQNLPPDQLKGLIAQVSGAEEQMIKQITGTFNSLARIADFEQEMQPPTPRPTDESQVGDNGGPKKTLEEVQRPTVENLHVRESRFNPEFRFNIEVHLPSNGTEDTYLAIFNALRKALG